MDIFSDTPINSPPQLPPHDKLNIAALSKLFVNTTAAYKFLWTLAILQIVKFATDTTVAAKQAADGSRHIMDKPAIAVTQTATGLQVKVADIILLMLEIAKPPINRYMLSFGKDDKVKTHLDNLAAGNTTEAKVCHKLTRFVLLRWIVPFLSDLPSTNDTDIREAARAGFDGARPAPYKIINIKKHILIHPDWLAYFTANNSILDGWTRWHWAFFLQKKNPNTPAIISKIAAPTIVRPAITAQKEFWHDVMMKTSLACLYSDTPLNCLNPNHVEEHALDHFIPRDYVGHDNLWNLVPVLPTANSSKSNQLPHGRYLRGFIARHCLALRIHRRHFPDKHKPLVETYLAGLQLRESDLLDRQKLTTAYRAVVPSLISLATASGFKSDWIYH